jgi:hypothetical protein
METFTTSDGLSLAYHRLKKRFTAEGAEESQRTRARDIILCVLRANLCVLPR